MCVLLVEDEDFIRIVLIEAMTDAGFEVIDASDAEAALALAETTPCPEVIVSDINLGPGMDGFALAAALRCRWPTVPVLMMSGRRVNFAGWHCGKAERFVSKPFALDAFVQHVIDLAGRPGSFLPA